MNYIQRLEHWGDTHHPKWLDLIRMALGIFLCYMGIAFLKNMSTMLDVMDQKMTFGGFTLMLLAHYVVFAHIMGGFLLALGLLTRFAALIQIPVLIGAIVFINSGADFFKPFSELWLSILVLVLLIYFLIAGDGPWSFNWFVERDKK